ncbi:helix-turn-helix domain-containing protein [Companilactobacillus baiquanensis]|uniref:Multiprotein-bridging factor 1 family protein n=1 Tax=Companilactobacillus baiquanensis TaxID=2486005 RepID=A0ABW1UYU2_9LACO|nr:helix-turn-helix transcriptional regulator [Companilactobacillus baiquanensis]
MVSTKREKFEQLLARQAYDPQSKVAFEIEKAKLDIATLVIRTRREAGITQSELAARVKVPQSTVARIENCENTSIDTLSKVASALDKKLVISFA